MDRYNFTFPKALIAQKPVHPRDAARLLIFDRRKKKTAFVTFKDLPKFLPSGSVLVLNQTKVIPARLFVKKETGGRVEILYLSTEGKNIKALANKKVAIGARLILSKRFSFVVMKQVGSEYFLKPSFPLKELDGIFERYGHTPLPPYIKHSLLSEKKLREEYQTVFAKERGSVAAPTASLHITNRLLKELQRRGIAVVYVTLHVGLGTFASVTERHIRSKTLHHERYHISKEAATFLNRAKKEGRPIIAVGTTVVRTLESSASSRRHCREAVSGDTSLFIQEGYQFKFIDGMITNFHVPKSSLLMLVSAFVGRAQVLKLYRHAIRKKFRLFSFGDGMLLL